MSEENELRACDKELLDACEALDVARVRAALENGADVNMRNEYNTPLIMCTVEFDTWKDKEAIEKCIQVLEVLFEYGVDPNQTDEDNIPLMWDASFLEPSVLEYLLQKGVNPNQAVYDDYCECYETPLMHVWVDEQIEPELDSLKQKSLLLLAYGARPYADEGLTQIELEMDKLSTSKEDSSIEKELDRALFYACQQRDYHTVQLAVKLGGDLGIHCYSGKMCLAAVAIRDTPIVERDEAQKYKWDLELLITEFVLFLLVGMKMPFEEKDIDGILDACKEMNFNKLRTTLLTHHSLGPKFQARVKK